MNVLLSVGALVVVLGVLVFIHEAGHFLAAKAAGIFVHRFSLGLGTPIKALSFTRGGTEYAVSWIPLGGYVKMATAEEDASSSALEGGTTETPVPPDQYFEAKPVWVRMIVILAGVTMNALFAWGVYTYLIAKNGQPVNPTTTVGWVDQERIPEGAEALLQLEVGDSIVAIGDTPVESWGQIQNEIQFVSSETVVIHRFGKDPLVLDIHPDALEERIFAADVINPFLPAVIGAVQAGMPADSAGLAVGDTVLAIDGMVMPQWYDMVEVLSQNPAQPLVLELGREGGRESIVVAPATAVDTLAGGETRTVGRLGIFPASPVVIRRLTPLAIVAAGARQTADNGTMVIRSVRGLLTARVSTSELGGPILIGQLAGATARLGMDVFLGFMALISINLAVLNLLPIPVLDGGQFLFLLAEAVLRRPLSLKLRERLTGVGLVMILMLLGLAFWNDLARIVRSFFG